MLKIIIDSLVTTGTMFVLAYVTMLPRILELSSMDPDEDDGADNFFIAWFLAILGLSFAIFYILKLKGVL